jgi:hypothetical protein
MKKILFIALIAASFASCKKSSSSTTANLDITVTNVVGNYKMTAATVSGVDVFSAGVTACKKDDIYALTNVGASGTYNYSITEGATSCTPPTAAVNSTYTLDNTAKTLTFNGLGATPAVLNGVVVTSTTIVGASSNFPGFAGVTVTMTFTKQ